MCFAYSGSGKHNDNFISSSVSNFRKIIYSTLWRQHSRENLNKQPNCCITTSPVVWFKLQDVLVGMNGHHAVSFVSIHVVRITECFIWEHCPTNVHGCTDFRWTTFTLNTSNLEVLKYPRFNDSYGQELVIMVTALTWLNCFALVIIDIKGSTPMIG